MSTDWKAALAALSASGAVPEGAPLPEETPAPEAEKQQSSPLRLYLDRKKRRGKEATIIEGFECSDERVSDIARSLKQKLGCGGSCRDGEILLQGDVRKSVADFLAAEGFKTKFC